MTWRKASERCIGNYIWWDAQTESTELLPLLECLSYAIEVTRPLEFFLNGVFLGEGPCGGDPGWMLYNDRTEENGSKIFHAWTHAEISGLDPCEANYDEATVKLHVRRTLENFRAAHPDRATEVDEVIAKYGL